MLNNITHLAELDSSYQTIKARVELYKGSALEKICNCGDLLSDFTVTKTGEGRYFGFGICQGLKVNLIDVDRSLSVTKENTIEASFGVGGNFIYPFPNFYIYDVNRDESSNLITVTAYDALYEATNHTVDELELPAGYSIRTFAAACARLLNIPLVIDAAANEAFDLMFESGANFDGSETIRAALNRIAEATQTIYYMDSNWNLYFKRLDRTGAPALEIHRKDYIDFQNEGELVLKSITHTTELGDSVSTVESESAIEEGVSQFIRDNPFLELRQDIGTLLDKAQTIVGGTVITQFELNWLGNYLLEIGDKISIEKEDGAYTTSYVMDDTIVFDGTLSQVTKWKYDDNSSETANNPTSLGEALNKTFARVDKVNQRIDLVVSDVNEQGGKVAELELTTNGLVTTVSEVQNFVTTATDDISGLKTTTSTHTEQIGTLQVSSSNIELRVQKVEEEVKAFEELETGTFIERVAEIELELDGITAAVEENTTEINTAKDDITSIENKVVTNTNNISALQLNADSITASVEKNQKEVTKQLGDLNNEVTNTKTELSNFKLESNNALLTFQTTVEENGVTKVDTGTGFKFDETGLNISKTNSEINTTITENGMMVKRYNEAVLTANNQGVNAINLHATTYLKIGSNSQLQDTVDGNRTACFWIGN